MDQYTRTVFASEPQYIGRTEDGGRVYVTATLHRESGAGKVTVDHEPAPAAFLSLSLVGEIYWPGDRKDNPSEVGQVETTAGRVVYPAAGWDHDTIAELVAYWRRWHLNDMIAACRHMPAIAPIGTPCEAGQDYTWGRAWLVEPLPESIANRIRGWFA